jgi:hypothetical protein
MTMRLDRRTLGKSAVALATLSTAGLVPAPGVAQAAPRNDAPSEPGPWWLIAPLRGGSELGHGWSLVDFAAVKEGACLLSLVNAEGRSEQLHVCRRGEAPRGLASTPSLDLLLMNGAQGDRASDEGLGLVVMGLAQRMTARERAEGAAADAIPGLLTHDERVARFGAMALARK